MRAPSLLVVALCSASACTGVYGETDDAPPPDTSDPECQLQSPAERSPGYPFDLQLYRQSVLPIVNGTCADGQCHGSDEGKKGLKLFANAEPGNCEYAKTFNALTERVDVVTPSNSTLLATLNGTNRAHPVQLLADDPALVTLTAFVDDAAARYAADGGGGTAPPGASPFDFSVYEQTIQPAFDSTGCAVVGCHGSGAAGYTLTETPAAGSAELEANFADTTARASLDDPPSSVIYLKATVAHVGGATPVLSPEDGQALLAWIEAATEAAGDRGDDANTCGDPTRFNAGVFEDEILPILAGQLDLNNPDAPAARTGCTASVCHGTDRGPGTLTLAAGRTAEENLQNFLCFVDLATPARSEVLACPLNEPGCRSYPHPGQQIFAGGEDANYQRILSYLFGSRLDSTPLDYAFFARRVNTIFNDVNAVENGAQGRTCADTQACHGISVAGQTASNGSNFPLFPNATQGDRLTFNFVSAAGFVNFLDPGQSSLFLYPTNEIANVDEHPLATGLPHPGGEDFAVDSTEALSILEWAGGLRADDLGFVRYWLVAGDYPASLISDITLLDEAAVEPAIFEVSGGAFNAGQWDGLFPGESLVDLNQVFPRDVTTGRAGFAVAYFSNLGALPRQIQLRIDTANPTRVYVDGLLVAQDDVGGGSNAILNLEPGAGSVRVTVKILQRANDPEFAFTAQLRDELGQPLSSLDNDVIVTLSPNGGL